MDFEALHSHHGHDYMESFRLPAAPAKGPSGRQTVRCSPFSTFFEPVALFNAEFVEDFCFYTSRTVSYMSHQSVSEPSFPWLGKIMSGGTLGLCLGK